MPALSNEMRADLLRDLTDLGAGQADAERSDDTGKYFYPVPEHARALEPEVVLIVGDRGAGKSALFNAVTNPDLLRSITRYVPGLRLPGRAKWIAGYPLHRGGPDEAGWMSFSRSHEGDTSVIASLWFTYLVRVLQELLDQEARDALGKLFACQGGDAEACYTAFQVSERTPLLALDRLDQALQDRDEWLFIAYDELDTLVRADWLTMGALVRGLVNFWAGYARRWKRLRAKIFLRTDLFRRSTEIGADIAKLSANRAELFWSDKNLFGMLIKRIANRSERLYEYCSKARPKVEFNQDKQLRYIPVLHRAKDARALVERIAGQYMGANSNKGHTFTWILDHLRDGNERAMPRALVRLIENSASIEMDHQKAEGIQLLHHSSLRRALDEVSKIHVVSAKTSEFLWLPGLERRVKGSKVPWDRKHLEGLLSSNWELSWGERVNIRPPADNAKELIEYLLEIGILRLRESSRRDELARFDVPDLFLDGLGLKRMGGVSRR